MKNSNGIYHSDEWRKNRSEKQIREGGWKNCNEPEQRMMASSRMKENWQNGKLNRGDAHWTKTEKGKQRISEMKKGKPLSDKARKNMSIAAAKRVRENPGSLYTRGRGGYREDVGQYFRSEWEAQYARFLNANGIEWVYEPKTFALTETLNYTPDFYLPKTDEWVEVKGYWDDKSILKCSLFEENYPELSLVKIDKTNYNVIEEYLQK